jgi:hypothetical protein
LPFLVSSPPDLCLVYPHLELWDPISASILHRSMPK